MKLFSKASILIFSIFGTTLFAALLFSDNLKQVNKSKHIASTIISALVWNIVVMKLLHNITIPFAPFLITNTLGGILLIGPSWKHHLGEFDHSFESRKIWVPLFSLLLFYSVILILSLNGYKP
ncbi:MAG: hypothetical protein ACK46O_06105 [Flavobacteriia bacterium]|jgi:hypothetical protein